MAYRFHTVQKFSTAQPSSLLGWAQRAPHLWWKWKIVYIYVYMFGTYVFRIYTFCPICTQCNISMLHVGSCNHCCSRDKASRTEGWTVGTNITGTWKQWGKGGTTSKTRRLIINVLGDTATNRRVLSVFKDRTISLWGPDPERSMWFDQITLVSNSCRRASKTPYYNSSNCVGWQYSLHHSQSIPHSWENSDSTAVAIYAQQLSMHYRPWLEKTVPRCE